MNEFANKQACDVKGIVGIAFYFLIIFSLLQETGRQQGDNTGFC
jgi:hypothetical protein